MEANFFMIQIQVNEPGGPESMKLVETHLPQLGPGQALVRVEAAGVNYIDVYFRTGQYPSERPITLGMEAAGQVTAVGEGVTEFAPGDRVAYAMARGSYASYAVVPVSLLVKVPEDVTSQMAAAAMLQGMTAHYLTHSTFPIKPGHKALVHAAAGGAGLVLVQMAKSLGAYVIGTVSTDEKADRARAAGCDDVILYTKEDFVAATKKLAGAVDVVYDSVGATTFLKGFDVLKPRGMMVLFGQSSGPVAPFEPQLLNAKGSVFLTRPSLGHHVANRQELLWRAGDVLNWVSSGRLEIQISKTYPLEDAPQAHRDLESRATSGKLLLIP
jgi:NADPH2:quinone reductase